MTRNGVPVVWMISGEDFESIMETLGVLADATAMQDVAQSRADATAGRYVTAPEMEKIMAARAGGIDLGDDADVVAGMHARGLPGPAASAALDSGWWKTTPFLIAQAGQVEVSVSVPRRPWS